MIDYYLKTHCCLICRHEHVCNIIKKPCEDCRCNGCVWLDKEIKKCIFSVNYPKSVSLDEIKRRIELVNPIQQKRLSDPKQRFVIGKAKP